MSLAMLINGQPSHQIPADDRGFQYGDGLFETALLVDGRVRFLDAHCQRLFAGCTRLGITPPDQPTLLREIAQITSDADRGVVKVIVTRGAGGRGYRPSGAMSSNRVVALHPFNPAPQGALELLVLGPRVVPVDLPHLDGHKPHGRPEPPLTKAPDDWLYVDIDGKRYVRETNTMPQWAGSCWYYLRFIDPQNSTYFVHPDNGFFKLSYRSFRILFCFPTNLLDPGYSLPGLLHRCLGRFPGSSRRRFRRFLSTSCRCLSSLADSPR